MSVLSLVKAAFVMPPAWFVKGAKRTDCEECQGKAWEHFDTNAGPEVERCDTCAPDGFGDAQAVQLHRIDCGCEWPENAPEHEFYEGRTQMPFATYDAEVSP